LELGEVSLQQFGDEKDILIRLARQEGGEAAQQVAVEKVKSALGANWEYRRTETVGPKVGGELIQSAALAIVLAVGGILIYVWVRYEWQFAINAILALFHDCITTVGLFSLLGLEFNLTTLAAILTIAGYSINDTVVIYDRMREMMRKHRTMPFRELINLALNETLSRTILTVTTVLLSVLALLFFGGEVLRGFSIAMLWGIVIGTYSTICVATPLLLYMNIRRTGAKAKEAPGDAPVAERG
jgi:preprotein translocase SecF subunit